MFMTELDASQRASAKLLYGLAMEAFCTGSEGERRRASLSAALGLLDFG